MTDGIVGRLSSQIRALEARIARLEDPEGSSRCRDCTQKAREGQETERVSRLHVLLREEERQLGLR